MSKSKFGKLALAAVFVFSFAAPRGFAAGSSAEAIRADHPIGAYVALWGDPFPALLGANIAYNVYDFVRLNAGVGTDRTSNVTATTFGAGAKLFVPKWALSPVVGFNWSADSTNGKSVTIRNIPRGGSRFYGNVGIDWQTTLGLSLGLGYNQSFAKGEGGSGYIQAGFFL